jgi:hypothetical protein
MDETEKLKKEIQELLAGGKKSESEIKKIIYDKNAKQFVIKIPARLALGAGLKKDSEVKIVVNPSDEDFNESSNSTFIIYGKEKKSTPQY